MSHSAGRARAVPIWAHLFLCPEALFLLVFAGHREHQACVTAPAFSKFTDTEEGTFLEVTRMASVPKELRGHAAQMLIPKGPELGLKGHVSHSRARHVHSSLMYKSLSSRDSPGVVLGGDGR